MTGRIYTVACGAGRKGSAICSATQDMMKSTRHFRKFCVSDFRQKQEYHMYAVQGCIQNKNERASSLLTTLLSPINRNQRATPLPMINFNQTQKSFHALLDTLTFWGYD